MNKAATPFVYQFLGDVNLFHSRVNAGWAHLGNLQLHAPEHGNAKHADAIAYVRPHDIEIDRHANGTGALPATISHIRAIGPVVRLELLSQVNAEEIIEVELTRERYQEGKFSEGEKVFIRPRNLKVFLANTEITHRPPLSEGAA